MIEIELKYYSIFLSTQLEALLWVENVIYVWWKSGEVMFTDYNHILSFLKIHRIFVGKSRIFSIWNTINFIQKWHKDNVDKMNKRKFVVGVRINIDGDITRYSEQLVHLEDNLGRREY